MITPEMIQEATDFLHKNEAWLPVIDAANHIENKSEMTCKDFLSHCTACGGNWGGMLLTGIKELFPHVWEVIPEDMGADAFTALCYTLLLCGVDTGG